jgi:hypothetical protein
LHRHENGGIAQRDERIPYGRRRLHQLVGDPARELVLEEAKALPQHVTVRLPTHAGLEGRRKHLILEEFVNEDDRRARNEYHERHPYKQSGVIAEKARSCRCALHEVDQLGDESREQYLAQGRQQVEKKDEREHRPYRPDEMPIE